MGYGTVGYGTVGCDRVGCGRLRLRLKGVVRGERSESSMLIGRSERIYFWGVHYLFKLNDYLTMYCSLVRCLFLLYVLTLLTGVYCHRAGLRHYSIRVS